MAHATGFIGHFGTHTTTTGQSCGDVGLGYNGHGIHVGADAGGCVGGGDLSAHASVHGAYDGTNISARGEAHGAVNMHNGFIHGDGGASAGVNGHIGSLVPTSAIPYDGFCATPAMF